MLLLFFFFYTVPSLIFCNPSLMVVVIRVWDHWPFLLSLQQEHWLEWRIGEITAPETRWVKGGHQDQRTSRYLFHVEWRTTGSMEQWSPSLDCAPHIGICTPQSRNCYLKIKCISFYYFQMHYTPKVIVLGDHTSLFHIIFIMNWDFWANFSVGRYRHLMLFSISSFLALFKSLLHLVRVSFIETRWCIP